MTKTDRFIGLAHKYLSLGVTVCRLILLLYILVSVVTNYSSPIRRKA